MTTATRTRKLEPKVKFATAAVPAWLADGAIHCDTPPPKDGAPGCRSVHQGDWDSAVTAGWRTDTLGLRRCPGCPDIFADAAGERQAAYIEARTQLHAAFDRAHFEILGGTPSWEAAGPVYLRPACTPPPAVPLISAAAILTALPEQAQEDQRDAVGPDHPVIAAITERYEAAGMVFPGRDRPATLRLESGGNGHFVPGDPAATRSDLPPAPAEAGPGWQLLDAHRVPGAPPLGEMDPAAKAHLAAFMAEHDRLDGKQPAAVTQDEAPEDTPGPDNVPLPAGPGAPPEDDETDES